VECLASSQSLLPLLSLSLSLCPSLLFFGSTCFSFSSLSFAADLAESERARERSSEREGGSQSNGKNEHQEKKKKPTKRAKERKRKEKQDVK
jgi:hypothetical protein